MRRLALDKVSNYSHQITSWLNNALKYWTGYCFPVPCHMTSCVVWGLRNKKDVTRCGSLKLPDCELNKMLSCINFFILRYFHYNNAEDWYWEWILPWKGGNGFEVVMGRSWKDWRTILVKAWNFVSRALWEIPIRAQKTRLGNSLTQGRILLKIRKIILLHYSKEFGCIVCMP